MTNDAVDLLKQSSEEIMNQIMDGALTKDSPENSNKILDLIPEDPDLVRHFADVLVKNKMPDSAFVAYKKGAELYVEKGMSLQAIIAKILEWSIVKPPHNQGKAFHRMLRNNNGPHSPLGNFFSDLTYPELVAVMRRLKRIHAKKGDKVITAGKHGNEIYFVVSGDLEETAYFDTGPKTPSNIRTVTRLGKNDIFGDVLPLEKDTTHCCDVKALSTTELVRISKPVLRAICNRYPGVRQHMEGMTKTGYGNRSGRRWRTQRKSQRRTLSSNVQLAFKKDNGHDFDADIEGITKDISESGMCLSLSLAGIGLPAEMLKRKKVDLNIQSMDENIKTQGKIVWCKPLGQESFSSALVGVSFDSLSKKDQNTMDQLYEEKDNSQEMILDLWSKHMK